MKGVLKLQNGSDIRGIACEGVAGEHVNLTNEAANVIARAFTRWLSARVGKETEALRIGVGHDSRITADSLMNEVRAGIGAEKATCFSCGLVSTPSMFMTTVFPETAFDGSIMITASHLPFNRNGLKFFTRDGGLEHDDITDILNIAEEAEPQPSDKPAEPVDSITLYTKSLQEKIKAGVEAEDYDHPVGRA